MPATIAGVAPGLVYFKSVFDPCWSNEDLAGLQSADYSWLLMILSPCERFYELGSRFAEMASRLPRLVQWHPAAPSRQELEILRNLVLGFTEQSAGNDPSSSGGIQAVHQFLTDLYVNRGRLITESENRFIGREIGARSTAAYIFAQLAGPAKVGGVSALLGARLDCGKENKALHWAALLSGQPALANGSPAYARAQLIDWMDSVEDFFGKMPEFPEAFVTTGIAREVKSVKAYVPILKPIFQSLRSEAFSLPDAIEQIGRNFAWDEERLRKWRRSLDRLGGLIRWLPAFVDAQDYLRAAFPLHEEKTDVLRDFLIETTDDPCRFFEANARNDFDQGFLEYKQAYVESYCALHESAFHVHSDSQDRNSRIDPVALRNLDLLSRLPNTSKVYLNRVNVLANWMQKNRCILPVRKILERYPRCYCNFNPGAGRQPADTGRRINAMIQEGTDYFRDVLRNCEKLIWEEVRLQQPDERISTQIALLLSCNPMVPLRPETVEVLNRIIRKYPNEFVISARKLRPGLRSGASRVGPR
jgi:hypothetical protein